MQTSSDAFSSVGTAALFGALPGNHLLVLPDVPTFTIAAVSDDYLAAVPVERSFLIGKGLFEVIFSDSAHKSEAAQLLRSFNAVLNTKQPNRLPDQHHWRLHPSANQRPQRIWRPSNKPVLDADGNVACIIHSVEDVSHAVQLDEVAEANRYLQTVIDQSKEPLQVLQPVFDGDEIVDFRFRLTNRAYAAYAGTTPESLQGKKVGDVFPGYFETSSFSNPVQTYETGEALTFEIHYDKDGLDLYNRMSTSKLGDEVFIYFTDFSDLKQLQLQLEQKVGELRHSNSYLEEFAYAASHDLKEPVRKIRAFSSQLKRSLDSQLSDTDRDVFTRLQSAADRMGTLIDDLLSYATASQQATELQTVNLNEVVAQVLQDLDLQIEQAEATIEVGALCAMPGNSRQWEQAFQNLIGNALKYARPGLKPVLLIDCEKVTASEVKLHLAGDAPTQEFYRIRVQDNGIGFEQQYAERIFQVFARLHGRAEYKGSGVGLATVRKVIDNHNGFIWAEGVPGAGATFTILLPAG